MSVDLSQFHQVFFEESFEGLDDMESGLLDLNAGVMDMELINTIFRGAHSIKGGSGTFGFTEIADFTHVMETLLDQVRSGERELTKDAVQVLLQSVDCLREMIESARDGKQQDRENIETYQRKLETLLNQGTDNGGQAVANEAAANEPDAHEDNIRGWRIQFHPYPNLMKTGNDPVRMFRELEQLGRFSAKVNSSGLPPFSDMDPEESYLSWELTLNGDCTEDEIKEIFEWVDDECNLSITAMRDEDATDVSASSEELQQRGLSGVDRRTDSVEGREQVVPIEVDANRGGGDKSQEGDRRAGKERRSASGESSSIRVSIDKIDALINMVGELVITQSMLSQIGESFDMDDIEKLRDGLGLLERNTRELQENVMQIRMLPISFSFNRFPRLVHDLSTKLGKKIDLKLIGESTELDKTVMEKIGDPLVHLVRNSLDHGIETPEARKAAGKPETGTITLNAYHEGGNIVIEVSDDGAGLDAEKILQKARDRGLLGQDETLTEEKIQELIFHAGFSTADQVSDVSGRGVGMDVVRRNISDLGGVVDVRSKQGEGSVFTIRLPLTLAILDGQLIRVGKQIYIIPLISIVESLLVKAKQCNSIAGKMELYRLRDDYIPIIRLHKIFNVQSDNTELVNGLLVVVEAEGQKAGLYLDDLLAQQQVVIKSLETNYQKITGISGATILGDGTVALILDISGLISLSREIMSREGLTEMNLIATQNTGSKAA